MTGYKLTRIEENGISVTDKDGDEVFVEAKSVVIAIGNEPDTRLYEQIKSLGITTYLIGDCVEPRDAKAAIREGALIGRAV